MTCPSNWKSRYAAAHLADFKIRYPIAYDDGHYVRPKYPDVSKARGLTNAIENFINWSGYRATRVNNIGRMADKTVTTDSGFKFTEKRYTRATRRGQADISSTIHGKSYMWEIKSGKDKPSEYQLREQALEERAGGKYYFIHSIEEFFEEFDRVVRPELFL